MNRLRGAGYFLAALVFVVAQSLMLSSVGMSMGQVFIAGTMTAMYGYFMSRFCEED
jgi:hypothetical protein